MKKVIEYQYVFKSDFKVREEVNYGTQRSISYIKDELQNSIEKSILGKPKKKDHFWLYGDGLKELLTMNPMGKHLKNEQNTIKNDISY